jgi:hypothetical protein
MRWISVVCTQSVVFGFGSVDTSALNGPCGDLSQRTQVSLAFFAISKCRHY